MSDFTFPPYTDLYDNKANRYSQPTLAQRHRRNAAFIRQVEYVNSFNKITMEKRAHDLVYGEDENPKMPDMKESKVEKHLVTGVEERGGQCPKFTSPGLTGVPDRLVILPGTPISMAEIKNEVGRLSERQVLVISQFEELGVSINVFSNTFQIDLFLDEWDHNQTQK